MTLLLPRAIGACAAFVVVTTAVFAASIQRVDAFTQADALAAGDAYVKAFVHWDGETAFITNDQTGGDPGFWNEAEEIEGIEDVNDHEKGIYKNLVGALLGGFVKAHGKDWSNNKYNDDICWATIAFTRGYEITGDPSLLVIARTNFDMMYARAWDPGKAALYWTTDNNTYNSCIECPAGIAAFLLSKTLHDPTYLIKAQALLTWEKANLFDASTGAVADAVNISGKIGTWSSTYNQGTFVGLANFLGDTASAQLAADFTRDRLGSPTTGPGRIMPEYGSGGGNNSGLNSIGLRWIARFMSDRKLQKDYLPWLQMNANAAWNIRRTSDNLSWCQWLQQTPRTNLHSWDCIASVVALSVTPPDGQEQAPPVTQ